MSSLIDVPGRSKSGDVPCQSKMSEVRELIDASEENFRGLVVF